MADREYTIPTPTDAEVNELAANLAAIDPERKGVEMKSLRVFYPKLGWGHLMVQLAYLKNAGRVTSKQRTAPGAKVASEFWTLTE